MSSHWVFQATLLALGSCKESKCKYTGIMRSEVTVKHIQVWAIVNLFLYLMQLIEHTSHARFHFISLHCISEMQFKAREARFLRHALSTACWPEKVALYSWCHRQGECYAHPPQPVYCGRRSCPGSALTLLASAAWWETGCQQISLVSANRE